MTTLTFAVVLPWTTLNGMPYSGALPLAALSSPQSGWMRIEVPMCEITAAELAAAGAFAMFWFQG